MKSRNTLPELLLADAIDELGLRYQMHDKELPGTPDIVFADNHMAVFVHGCYWHRHAGCPLATVPKSESIKWISKFEAAVRRDQEVAARLRKCGWRVYVGWECDILRSPKAVADDIAAFLSQAPAVTV